MTRTAFAVLTVAATVFAQSQPPAGGWRRVTDPPSAPATAPPSDAYGQPVGGQIGGPAAGPPANIAEGQQPPAADRGIPFDQNDRPLPPLPPQLTVKPGTYITVRVNQLLTTDHNQLGDTFSATLAQPVVVDGVIVAGRGQTIYGRVAESVKPHAGKPSRLGLELTGLTLVDGTQTSVRSQLVGRKGGTTPTGQEVGTVATTTAVGASIGAIADWGTGAAIGAGVGAAGGLIGVLLTHNHPTVVYPESVLTFATSTAVNVDTGRAPLAFRYVDPSEYDRPVMEHRLGPPPPQQPVRTLGWYGGPAYTPYYWGPGISFVYGGGYYGRPYRYYGRPVYRRWR